MACDRCPDTRSASFASHSHMYIYVSSFSQNRTRTALSFKIYPQDDLASLRWHTMHARQNGLRFTSSMEQVTEEEAFSLNIVPVRGRYSPFPYSQASRCLRVLVRPGMMRSRRWLSLKSSASSRKTNGRISSFVESEEGVKQARERERERDKGKKNKPFISSETHNVVPTAPVTMQSSRQDSLLRGSSHDVSLVSLFHQ